MNTCGESALSLLLLTLYTSFITWGVMGDRGGVSWVTGGVVTGDRGGGMDARAGVAPGRVREKRFVWRILGVT